MRPPATLLALLLLASSGCSTQEGDLPPPDPAAFLVDPRGDAQQGWDLLAANFTELSGSLVLRIEIARFEGQMPLVEARLLTTTGAHYVRLLPDPSRPEGPQLRAEAGRLDGENRLATYDTCWDSQPFRGNNVEGPSYLFLELLHNRTGLTGGGTVRGLTLTAYDDAGTRRDEGGSTREFEVRGGANPYVASSPTCPLHWERNRVP